MTTINDKIHLITERLIIDELTGNNLEFFLGIEQIEENKRYEMTGVSDYISIVDKFNKFMNIRQKLPQDGGILFVVKSCSEIPMGYITLMCNWEKTKEWELGYSFLPTHLHKGYAYESVLTVIRFAFKELKIHKLMAFVNAENIPSIKLLERLNMTKEGHMREARLINGKWADEYVFAMIESDLTPSCR